MGIIVSNPLEVLKVRLQTNSTINSEYRNLNELLFSRSPSPIHHGQTTNPITLALHYSIPPNGLTDLNLSDLKHSTRNIASIDSATHSITSGLKTLWHKEGYRFLFAGAAAPILGLAFIDSFFFATYGKCMTTFNQDRERPSKLPLVFASGAIAGGVCALLQTPIEVIKCRAQAELLNHETGSKTGSFSIARKIYQRDGFQGFYLGGFMTGLRDSMSSGIFFTSYALIRGGLRDLCSSNPVGLWQSANCPTTSNSRSFEILVNMVSGGTSGLISALVPYPLDIIKTRLQVTKVTSSYQASSNNDDRYQIKLQNSSKIRQTPSSSSIIAITQQIYAEGKHSILPKLQYTRFYRLYSLIVRSLDFFKNPVSASLLSHSDLLAQRRKILKVSLKVGGLVGFFRGIKPTLLSSFVGSAITMGIFEFVFDYLGK